jgi:integrase/DNA-binding CsgD family transcriptional regulator
MTTRPVPHPVVPHAPPTVGDLLTLYEHECLPFKAASTARQYPYIFQVLRTEIGHVALADVRPATLRALRDTLLQRYPSGTARRYLHALSSAFTTAVKEYEWMPENPFRRVRFPSEGPARRRLLSEVERQRLLIACEVHRNRALYPLVLLALSTGARKNELRMLRWRHVTLEQGTLTFERTKNGETRTVPVVGLALQVLRGWRLRDRASEAWVFPRADGQAPILIDATFRGVVRRLGLSDFRFHDLRHSAASYLAMSGASLLDIAAILGHKTLRMVQRYAHLSPAHTAGVLERMAHQFLGSPSAAWLAEERAQPLPDGLPVDRVTLGPQEHRIWALHTQGWTARAIATEMGTTLNTVKSTLYHVRVKLRTGSRHRRPQASEDGPTG